MKKISNKIKVFDFFSGCGGTSLGLQQAGCEIVFGSDIDHDASKTFSLNFPNAKFIERDIKKINHDDIEYIIKEQKDNYILFSGCAPCQPFSAQNKNKKNDDPRANLLNYFSNLVNYFEPDFVIVENVRGMQRLKSNSGPFFDFLEQLKSKNYHYTYGIVSALWYGVPQKRERLILIASKHSPVSLPTKVNDGINTPFSTVREWIYTLPPIAAGESHPTVTDHISSKLTDINLKRIRLTPEGKGRESWPSDLLVDCHKNYSGHSDVYGRLSWDKPASVLTTKCISYSNGRFGHPEQDRAISVREAASLQTFPMSYKFYGSTMSKARQIGNAVPPKMSEAIGKSIISSL